MSTGGVSVPRDGMWISGATSVQGGLSIKSGGANVQAGGLRVHDGVRCDVMRGSGVTQASVPMGMVTH